MNKWPHFLMLWFACSLASAGALIVPSMHKWVLNFAIGAAPWIFSGADNTSERASMMHVAFLSLDHALGLICLVTQIHFRSCHRQSFAVFFSLWLGIMFLFCAALDHYVGEGPVSYLFLPIIVVSCIGACKYAAINFRNKYQNLKVIFVWLAITLIPMLGGLGIIFELCLLLLIGLMFFKRRPAGIGGHFGDG